MEIPKDKYDEWHKDPSNWRLWVFYYNKEDPRLFPSKRVKSLGWTVNFGNPLSILVFIVLVVLFGLIFKGIGI